MNAMIPALSNIAINPHPIVNSDKGMFAISDTISPALRKFGMFVTICTSEEQIND